MASTTVHSLIYKMTANTGSFTRGITKARSDLTLANRLFRESRTPAENYQQAVTRLNNLLQRGAITPDTYRRSLSRLQMELRKSSTEATKSKSAFAGFGQQLASTFGGGIGGAAVAGGVAGAVVAVITQAVAAVRRVIDFAIMQFKRLVRLVISEVREAFERVDEIAKISGRLGILPSVLQATALAAGLSGTELETVSKSMFRMQKSIVDANDGLMTQKRAFDRLGLSAKDLIDLPLLQQYQRIVDALNRVENATIRNATAQDIFGRQGKELLTLFAAGGDAIDKQRRFLDQFGVSLTELDARSVEEANDAWERLGAVFDGIFNKIAARLSPAFITIAEQLAGTVSKGDLVADVVDAIGETIESVIPVAVNDFMAFIGVMEVLGGVTLQTSAAFTAFAGDVKGAMQQLDSGQRLVAEGLERLGSAAQGNFFVSFQRRLEEVKSLLAESTNIGAERVGFLEDEEDAVDGIGRSWGEVIDRLKEHDTLINGLRSKASSLMESLLTPAEKLQRTLEDIRQMQDVNALNADFADRARRKAFADFRKDAGGDKGAFLSSIRRGSQDEYKFLREISGSKTEDSIDELKKIEMEALGVLREIRDDGRGKDEITVREVTLTG